MNLYLDASVLVALFVIDPASAGAAAFLAAHPAIVVVSDFGAAEFSSAVARRRADARPHTRRWAACVPAFRYMASAGCVPTRDHNRGYRYRRSDLRRLDVNLRTPDAIHIAVTQRVEATLVTFDRGMAAAARALGVAVAIP